MEHYSTVLGDRVGGVLQRVKEALPTATAPVWSNSQVPFEAPDIIFALSRNVGLPVTVGQAVKRTEPPAWRDGKNLDAQCIASYRNDAPLFAGAFHNLAMALESTTRPLTTMQVRCLLAAPWADNNSRWNWMGWDAAKGEPVAPNEWAQARTTWDLETPETVAWTDRYVSRASGSLLRAVNGTWRLAPTPARNNELLTVATDEGVEVARFFRSEDASFVVLAREAISVLGGAFAAVDALCGDDPDALLEPSQILDAILQSKPFPLTLDAEFEATERTLPQ